MIRELCAWPDPCSNFASSRKFCAVRGTTSSNKRNTIRPACFELIATLNYIDTHIASEKCRTGCRLAGWYARIRLPCFTEVGSQRELPRSCVYARWVQHARRAPEGLGSGDSYTTTPRAHRMADVYDTGIYIAIKHTTTFCLIAFHAWSL
jgi:hypothetical protein